MVLAGALVAGVYYTHSSSSEDEGGDRAALNLDGIALAALELHVDLQLGLGSEVGRRGGGGGGGGKGREGRERGTARE